MGRTIHIGDGTGGYARVEIPDQEAGKLISSGLLYECGEDEGHGHDLHINPTWDKFSNIETLVLGIAVAQNKTFTIGDATMRLVFEPAGLRNMSDMQAVMDAVEKALHKVSEAATLAVAEVHSRSNATLPNGMVAITTNGTTRIIPADEPVFLLRGQDGVAADVVREWCNLAHKAGADEAILEEASRHADKMDAWPVKKVPDLPGQRVPIDEHLPKEPSVPSRLVIEEGRVRKGGRNEDPTAGFARRPAAPVGSAPEHKGLPVAGYAPMQSQEAIDLVNEGKLLEERLIRWAERVRLHSLQKDGPNVGYEFAVDGIRQVQIGCMLLYRAVFQPNGSRLRLPEDPDENEVPF